jgi:hypothetical protein
LVPQASAFFGDDPIGSPQVAYAVPSAYPQYREWLDTNHKLKAPATGQKLHFFITHYAVVRMKVCANTVLAGGLPLSTWPCSARTLN